jgi:hypothetical protein
MNHRGGIQANTTTIEHQARSCTGCSRSAKFSKQILEKSAACNTASVSLKLSVPTHDEYDAPHKPAVARRIPDRDR